MTLINNQSFKYVTMLGCVYFRLTSNSKEIYTVLEELYADYRKIRYRDSAGNFHMKYVDEVIEELLSKEVFCDIVMPR
jgi:pre-mRNA-splicing factor 38A